METNTQAVTSFEQELKDLGFTKAAEQISVKEKLARKMMVAYEHFRFVTKANINAFNEKLKKETATLGPRAASLGIKKVDQKAWDANAVVHKKLVFLRPDQYTEAPPRSVLQKMKAAKDMQCFDRFEIAKIEHDPDPIVFGVIEGCEDYFFVDQWDDDVKIEDIIQEGQG